MRKLKAIIVYEDPFRDDDKYCEWEEIEVNDDMETLHKIINCETYDFRTEHINGYPVTIGIDDEGKLKNKNWTGLRFTAGDPVVGNILICGPADEEGELTDIYDRAIEQFKKRFKTYPFFQFNNIIVFD